MAYPFVVIDDNDFDCLIISKIISLTNKNEEVLVFKEAKAALAHVTALQFSAFNSQWVIVLDILMPEMDGFQFLDEFLKLPHDLQKHFKIIILTLSNNPHTLKRLTNYEAVNAILEKPITLEKLNTTLREIM